MVLRVQVVCVSMRDVSGADQRVLRSVACSVLARTDAKARPQKLALLSGRLTKLFRRWAHLRRPAAVSGRHVKR